MDHWRKVLPINIFEVQYEDLVENQEDVSKKMINYCGLEWNQSCLDFQKNERLVKTASHIQVRQKIYKTSVERWRNYEKQLAPLAAILRDSD